MLKFEVPQDEAFYEILIEALTFGLETLEREQKDKTPPAEQTFPRVVKLFGFTTAKKAIKELMSVHPDAKTLYQPCDNYLFIVHQIMAAFVQEHNDEVVESGSQEYGHLAVGMITLTAMDQRYFGDMEFHAQGKKTTKKLDAKSLSLDTLPPDDYTSFFEFDNSCYRDDAPYPIAEDHDDDNDDDLTYLAIGEDDDIEEEDDNHDDYGFSEVDEEDW